MRINGIQSISIDGVDCFTIKQFAKLVDRTAEYIRYLISTGNMIRKLKVRKIDTHVYLPVQEIFDFPFVTQGANSNAPGAHVKEFFLEEGRLKSRVVYKNKNDLYN